MSDNYFKGEREVLDHGTIRLIRAWGSDEEIVETARVSTQKGFLGWGPIHAETCQRQIAIEECICNYGYASDAAEASPCTCDPKVGDEKLLKFLYDNKHSTPFEFGGITIEVQAPIMVFREWHRHRTQSYSEASARYAPLPDLHYVPTLERLLPTIGNTNTNKQAGSVAGTAPVTREVAEEFRCRLAKAYRDDQELYEWALVNGIAKELARLPLSVGRYSRMRATGNLRNWLAFLTLRTASNAQYEIRVYAQYVEKFIGEIFPRTHHLFVTG